MDSEFEGDFPADVYGSTGEGDELRYRDRKKGVEGSKKQKRQGRNSRRKDNGRSRRRLSRGRSRS